MSILSALKQQHSSIDSLAALPQAMIMQMAQKKQISEEMLAPILARKAELADAFARENALQGANQAPPTVMEQLIAKNAQAEQPQMAPQMVQVMPQEAPQNAEDVGIASQATEPMSLAGGGIIAFAGGDLVDEEDDREESRFLSMMDAIPAGIRSIPSKLSSFASSLPKSYESAKADITNAMASVPAKMGNHKYEADVIAEAKRQGVDPKLALHVLYKETGGHKNPDTARSHAGALGPMQLMPKTAKSLGVDPADPMQNIYGGVKYLAQLGPMFDNDPRLTAAAYNAGPGNVRKHGGVPKFKETQNYVQGLANGGEVRYFANDGYVGYGEEAPYDPDAPSIYDTFGTMIGSPLERLKNSIYGIGAKTNKEIQRDVQTKKAASAKVYPPIIPPSDVSPSAQDFRNFDQAAALYQAENMGKNVPMQTQAAPKSGIEAFMEQMGEQKSELAKQRQEDKNMAILTAGLGMLGGSSQHAFENIGKGALAGVQNLGESRKARIAEQNAIDRNLLYAHHYKGVEDVARENAAAQQAYRGETLKETSRANTNKEIEHAQANFNNYLKIQQDNLKARFPAGELDPGYQAAMAEIQRSVPYQSLAKRAGFDVSPVQSTFTPKQTSLLDKYLRR
jgi:soluble lytic murein transglycosylase-like protein